MSVLDEQLVHTRSELYMEIKIICEPLIKHTGSMTRDFGRIATSCLTELLHKLESVSDPEAVIDPVLIDAILYPLFRLFKEVVQDSLYFDTVFEGLLHCLRFLLNNTLWSCTFSNSMSKQSIVLYTNCLKRFNNNNNNNNKSDRSLTSGATDSIKLLAIQCISASLPIPPSRISTAAIDQPQHHNIHLLPVLYSEPFKYILSETVLELLAIIQRDHDLTLRLAALDTLHQLLFDNLQEPDYLSLFLPGVTSTLCKVIWQKQEKEHHQVIIYALDIISNMVQCVMEISRNKDFLDSVHSLEDLKHIWQTMSIGNEDDENDNKKKDDISTGVNKIDSGTDEQQSTKSTIWTQERYKQTKEALYNLLKGVLKICNHPHWEVRLAFVDLCYKLLKKCWATLDNCIPLFINTVVQLVDDEYPQVASTCKQHISDLNCMYDFETSLMPDLKEGLYTAMMTLPQHLISGDEQSKLYAMRRITGYTYFLQHHAGTVFDAALNRISDGWMAALEIDKHSLNVLEEKQSTRYIELGDDEISTQKQQQQQLQQGQQRSLRTVAFPALRFKHLVTTATAEQATHMLNIIAQFVPLQRWLTHFMAYIHVDDEEISLDQVQPEAAFIIHSLLAGAVTSTMTLPGSQTTVGEFILYDNKENNTGDTQETTKTTTLELQKQAHRILTDMTETLTAMTTTVNKSKEAKKSTKLTTSGNPSTTIELEGNKVVTICLGLQIISLAAYIIGRDRTEEHLIKLLYPVLAHLGSTNVSIHTYALISLDNIAIVCGKQNGRLLAMGNMDYIINAISQRISFLYENPQAPLVLKALVRVGGIDTLNYLQDSVEEIFDALDRYHLHDWACHQLCGTLFEIVQTAAASIPSSSSSSSSRTTTTTTKGSQGTSNIQISPAIADFIRQQKEYASSNENKTNDTPTTMEEIGKFFMDQRKAGKQDKDLLELMAQTEKAGKGMMDDDKENDDDHPTDEVIPLSNMEDLTLKIMTKSIHFLTSPSGQLKAQMLQLFTSGTRILAARTDKLDPLIHQVWPLIMHRLDDPTHYVAYYAAELVQALTETSGEFISRRFVENVWPRFEPHLAQAKQHMTTSSTPIYSTYSYPHRLQRCILKTLILAALHIHMSQQVALAMAEATTWLLSRRRVRQELQDLTIQLYLALYQHHPDALWFHVFSLMETPVIQPPTIPDDLSDSITLDPMIVPDWMMKKEKDYYTNARNVMDAMEHTTISV